ncbi:MAG: hypothetical protein MK033_00105 [Candidatus Caenarcaniphilales bacterium]|nr:hypothetical protein [Candidatus Caenarcaniphilales bacterium]
MEPRCFEKRRTEITSKNLDFVGLSATYSANIISVEKLFETSNSVIDTKYKKRGSKLILTGKLKDQNSDSPSVADERYKIVLD